MRDPGHEQFARVRGVEAGEETQERGLAAPALPQQGDELAAANLQVEPIERRVLAELTNQLVGVDGEGLVPRL